jgi:hypothetical protein
MKRDLEDGPAESGSGQADRHSCPSLQWAICPDTPNLSPQSLPFSFTPRPSPLKASRARSKTRGPHPTALDPHPLPGASRSCARPSSQAFTDSRAQLAAARLRRLSSFKPPSLQLWSAARCARLHRKRLHSLPGHAYILGALRGLVICARHRHSPAKRLAHSSPASHY